MMSCPLKFLRVILLLGGESVDGNFVGWFKTAKHRFGLHRFGQATLKGIYRWLVLSLIAYLIGTSGILVYCIAQFT
jgi:hypothetical protein